MRAKSFNSLQTGKHIQRGGQSCGLPGRERGFNSLQTGKHIQSIAYRGHVLFHFCVEFQFPSNGKAYPKLRPAVRPPRRFTRVSIPFKRESISKALILILININSCNETVSIPFKRESISKAATTRIPTLSTESFNSLQTGKHIQSNRCEGGKMDRWCFNSLQTGKHIQSMNTFVLNATSFCFNSLQTGKHIQRQS